MTSTKTRTVKATPETVDVVVVVNHHSLRAGETGTVELDDDVRALLDRGYLRLADDTDLTSAAPLGAAATGTGPGSLLGVTADEDRSVVTTLGEDGGRDVEGRADNGQG